MHPVARSLIVAAVSIAARTAHADELRELSTDRPDTTESPYTVDAGHVQVESDLVTAAFDDDAREASFLALNMKLGIHRRIDLQLVIEPHRIVRSDTMSTSGFGDTTLRAKLNLWGNDEGTTAACLMPFVSLPTATHGVGAGGTEGGLIFVFGGELPRGFEAATMVEGDLVRDEMGDLAPALVVTATTSHDLVGDLGGFVEGIATVDADGVVPEVRGGFSYAIGRSAELDGGLDLTLDDRHTFAPFLGAAFKR